MKGIKLGLFFVSGFMLIGCGGSKNEETTKTTQQIEKAPMIGEFRSRTTFDNPYANIPPQSH